jgi:nucleotide-binding universal stress UspA family protein
MLTGMSARPRKIVVGFDGSEASRQALDTAADLTGYGSTLAVVSVRTAEVRESAAPEARTRLHERHVEAHYLEPVGDPSERLVEAAEQLGADLLVVGRRSRTPARSFLGSVSSRVVRHAPCDVLVVRTPATP